MTFIFCLALASASILGVGRRGRFSYLSFPDMTVTVGIFPNGFFRRCSPFVYLFIDFRSLKHSASSPSVGNCVKKNLVDLFRGHILGGDTIRGREEVNYSFPLVVHPKRLNVMIRGYVLRVSLHAFSWRG